MKTPHQNAATEAGGTLIITRFATDLDRYAPGCGTLTHVHGTNGGKIPCGAMLKQLDGTTAPYFCGHCHMQIGRASLIERINALHTASYGEPGTRVDLAIELIRAFGVFDYEETRQILRETAYAEDGPGSVAAMILHIGKTQT